MRLFCKYLGRTYSSSHRAAWEWRGEQTSGKLVIRTLPVWPSGLYVLEAAPVKEKKNHLLLPDNKSWLNNANAFHFNQPFRFLQNCLMIILRRQSSNNWMTWLKWRINVIQISNPIFFIFWHGQFRPFIVNSTFFFYHTGSQAWKVYG